MEGGGGFYGAGGAKRAETEADAMLPTSLFDVLHHRRRKEAVPISEEALEVTETVATPLSFKVSLDAKDAEMIYCGDTRSRRS